MLSEFIRFFVKSKHTVTGLSNVVFNLCAKLLISIDAVQTTFTSEDKSLFFTTNQNFLRTSIRQYTLNWVVLTVPHAHINALNDVLYARIYPAALLFQGRDVTCVYYHSLRNASHTNSIAFHSIHKCICKSPHTVVIVF